MTDAIDLTTEERTTLNELLRRFLPGVAVRAYGSRVKWNARPNSDLDLVVFTTPAQCPQVAELKEALAESNLPFPVDLHVWDDVPERFREIIRKEYVVVQEAKEPESGSGIADGWNSCTIGDLCDAGIVELQTGPFGTQLHAHDYVEDGVPVVPTEAIRNRQIDHSVLPKVASGKAEELARHRLEGGDILFARRGVQATGHIGCVREAEEGFLCGTGAIRLRVREGGGSVNPDFLSHVLANPASVEWFKFHAIGATMPNLNEGIIRSFPLQIPPMAEQRAIAHILGALDDKIELNRKMNETLEAMARALFKSWFVDFDPVRAKAQGRDLRMPKSLANLFPDSFEDSELGETPRGWEVKAFADTIEIVGGGTPRTSVADYWDGDIPWFSVVDAPADSEVWVLNTEKKVTRAGVQNSSTRVLPVGMTIISARGTVGRVALVGVPMAMNQSCYGLQGRIGVHGFFTYFSTRELVARLQQHAHGSVFDTITRDTLAGVSVVEPEAALIEEFEKRVAPILHRMREGLLETRTLTALRDTLLRKLISGELRLEDSARFLRDGN